MALQSLDNWMARVTGSQRIDVSDDEEDDEPHTPRAGRVRQPGSAGAVSAQPQVEREEGALATVEAQPRGTPAVAVPQGVFNEYGEEVIATPRRLARATPDKI